VKGLAALAGLETGVLGGLAVLGWYALIASFSGETAGIIPRDLSSAVFGWTLGSGNALLGLIVGCALQLAVAGFLGAAFGLLAGRVSRLLRMALLGMVLSLSAYYLLSRFLPVISGADAYRFLQRKSVIVGHALLGAFMAFYPRFFNGLVVPEQPPPQG
jgi:hypothetical protein